MEMSVPPQKKLPSSLRSAMCHGHLHGSVGVPPMMCVGGRGVPIGQIWFGDGRMDLAPVTCEGPRLMRMSAPDEDNHTDS